MTSYWFNVLVSWEQALGLETALNITNSLGNLSPMLRKCNLTSGDIVTEAKTISNNFETTSSFYKMLKNNVVANYTDMDDRSTSLYQATGEQNWGDVFFDASRLLYLFFLQTNETELNKQGIEVPKTNYTNSSNSSASINSQTPSSSSSKRRSSSSSKNLQAEPTPIKETKKKETKKLTSSRELRASEYIYSQKDEYREK